MSNNIQQSAPKKYNFCNSQLKTATDKFVWTIDNFSKRKQKSGESLQSELFTSTMPNGKLLKWRLEIYPNGYSEVAKDYISLFLCLIDSNNEEVKAKPQFSIQRCDGFEVVRSTMQEECHNYTNAPKWGPRKLLSKEKMFNGKYGLLNGDRLTIVCKLVVEQESVEISSLPDVEVPECRGMDDVLYLFEKSLFPDCKITSEDNKDYKVHKCILSCRSPVFAAMFEHGMIERNNNEVNIVDIKGYIIEQLLRFIYSGKEPANLGEMADDLLVAADKYGLTRLKLLCERKLIGTLGNANACGLLTLANLYSAQHLKAHAINYIKIHGNEVMKSAEWKTLANEELKEQILKAIMEK